MPAILWTITVILVIGWLLGVVGIYAVGSWIHLLLVIALVVLIVNLLSAAATPGAPRPL